MTDNDPIIEVSEDKLKAVAMILTSTTEKNIIICDTRESRSGRPTQLESAMKAWGIECKFYDVQLPIGDYIVNGACIEFKTAEDFIQSKISGHLDLQLFNMSARYPNSYLVVEGSIDEQSSGRVHPNAILSSKIGASFRRSSVGVHGMVNFIEIREGEFPTLVKFMLSKQHIRYPPPLKVPVNKSEQAVATLSSIPRVSTVRARRLIEHFGSLAKVFSASEQELQEVKGIQSYTACAIREYIDRTFREKEEYVL
jgi:Fanconi anemia group M protein